MKKIILALTATAFLFAMTGCGKEDEQKAEKPKAAEKQEKKAKEDDFIRGKWVDFVYTNEFLNLSFQLPEGFIHANDEQLAEMMNLTLEDVSNGSELSKEILKQRVIMDMVVKQSDGGSGVNIVLENLSTVNNYQEFTVEQYAESARDLLTRQGAVIQGTHQEELAGETYLVITSDLKQGEEIVHNRQFCKKYGKYMMVITFSTLNDHEHFYEQLKANFHHGYQEV
ncbi:hypothetical protein GSF08_00240 [Clostridiaceae bacterium DONG20-135]|uniref:Lipoprotein n=1 Tax=Copranaerobaculum intestinale TaxID=2692629 RepID=A0A6N8U274_9FIRM|nr:hypothetical protein [Copranaerobaculum intestinale]MXQ72368.1 hypothetical protein [Copranaerobaculum intestinale]